MLQASSSIWTMEKSSHYSASLLDSNCLFAVAITKRKIHARYPFLGSGSYQPPVLSVLYLQVGYQPVAAGKSRVIYVGPTRFPYPLSDNYTRRPTRCPYPLSDEYKRRVPHTTRYPEDMIKCWGSKREKGMVHNAGARQVFRKYGHPYIYFFEKGYHTQPAVKWSLKKLGT